MEELGIMESLWESKVILKKTDLEDKTIRDFRFFWVISMKPKSERKNEKFCEKYLQQNQSISR